MGKLGPRFGVQLTADQLVAVDGLVIVRNDGAGPHYSRWSRQRVLREAVDSYLAAQIGTLADDRPEATPEEPEEEIVAQGASEGPEEPVPEARRIALFTLYTDALLPIYQTHPDLDVTEEVAMAFSDGGALESDLPRIEDRLLAKLAVLRRGFVVATYREIHQDGGDRLADIKDAVRRTFNLPVLSFYSEEVERWLNPKEI